MMYTKGIRKIFSLHHGAPRLSMIQSMAENAGYSALSFNGRIMIKTEEDGWVETCFHITDFSDEQV